MEVESRRISFLFFESIITKFLQEDLKTLHEGRVSQNSDLCSRSFFMLCRNFKKLFFHNFFLFYGIK